jgi:hypothetical protein
MNSKTLTCRQCQETLVLWRDSYTGMWELPFGHGSISNFSWEYLQDTWQELHGMECVGNGVRIEVQ